jgi:FkbM family methyltransferase
MIQWLLEKTVKLAQYAQGIGAAGKRDARADRAVLRRLRRSRGGQPLILFDAGANRGSYIRLAQNVLSNRQIVIHAFEPSEAAFSALSAEFAPDSRIVLNNLALGSEAASMNLYYDVPGSELSSLYPRDIAHHGIQMIGKEFVRVETLDAYCQAHNITRIDLLKLDVEGHELEVLRGAAQMFERKQIAQVGFEFGGCNVDARTFLRDFFQFFVAHDMSLARVTAFGGLRPIPRYKEELEQFRTTCFVASRH